MTIDAILEIQEAEKEAERIVRASIEDSRALVEDARTQAAQLMEEAAAGGRTAAEEKNLLAVKRADAETEKIKRKIAVECEQITRGARAKFSEAAAIIAGRIIKANVDR